MATSAYTPAGTYNDAALSDADKALINAAQQKWLAASSAGDQAGMSAAHAEAEAVRAKYSYSGGSDGSEYVALPSGGTSSSTGSTTANLSSGSTGTTAYTTYTAPVTASSAATYINELYAAQQASNLNALKSAYNQNVLALSAAGSSIPEQYQDARNQTAAQSEVQRLNFNEYAAGRGLNSGAGSQAYLSMGNALQGNLSGISKAETGALSSLELQRAQLEASYQSDVAQAISDNNLAKAKALYDDYVRVDNSLVSAAKSGSSSGNSDSSDTYYYTLLQQAQKLAQYGDFSGYSALGYTAAQINSIKELYAIQNNWYNS